MARAEDNGDPHPKHKARVSRSWGGTVVAVGGTLFALLSLWRGDGSYTPAVIGFVAALIGAGMIDPSLVTGWLRRR